MRGQLVRVHLVSCHVTYSLFAGALVFASGWMRPGQTLDLTRTMFSGAAILTELFASLLQQIERTGTIRGFVKS